MTAPALVPAQIGPCQFGRLGQWVTVRCLRDYAPLLKRAGGMWDPGGKCGVDACSTPPFGLVYRSFTGVESDPAKNDEVFELRGLDLSYFEPALPGRRARARGTGS